MPHQSVKYWIDKLMEDGFVLIRPDGGYSMPNKAEEIGALQKALASFNMSSDVMPSQLATLAECRIAKITQVYAASSTDVASVSEFYNGTTQQQAWVVEFDNTPVLNNSGTMVSYFDACVGLLAKARLTFNANITEDDAYDAAFGSCSLQNQAASTFFGTGYRGSPSAQQPEYVEVAGQPVKLLDVTDRLWAGTRAGHNGNDYAGLFNSMLDIYEPIEKGFSPQHRFDRVYTATQGQQPSLPTQCTSSA